MTPDKAILEMLESVSKDDTDTLDEFEILEKFTRAFELIKENHPPTGNIENYSHIYVISASGEEIKITPFDVERARNILDNRTDKHQAIIERQAAAIKTLREALKIARTEIPRGASHAGRYFENTVYAHITKTLAATKEHAGGEG